MHYGQSHKHCLIENFALPTLTQGDLIIGGIGRLISANGVVYDIPEVSPRFIAVKEGHNVQLGACHNAVDGCIWSKTFKVTLSKR